MRLINAEDVIIRLHVDPEEWGTPDERWRPEHEYAMAIMTSPEIDPVKHGHWEWDKDGMDWGIGSWRCSICGRRPNTFWNTNKRNPKAFGGSLFCGECGAKMDGDEE